MANSAWSGNTAGLASATSPGLVGITTQTFAGKKTLDGGALIKGDTSGVAIAAGYVGERYLYNWAINQTTNGVNQITLADQTISAGVWLILVNAQWLASNGATGSTGNDTFTRINGTLGTVDGQSKSGAYVLAGQTRVAAGGMNNVFLSSTSWTFGITQNFSFTSGIVANYGAATLIRIA